MNQLSQEILMTRMTVMLGEQGSDKDWDYEDPVWVFTWASLAINERVVYDKIPNRLLTRRKLAHMRHFIN